MNWFPNYNFILASKSARRQHLLKLLEIDFQIVVKEVKEDFPANLPKEEIPVYLARLKAKPFITQLEQGDLLITADTIVWHKGKVLGKPSGVNEAKKMLSELSGSEHKVISGVCLTSSDKQKAFYSVSNVQFKELNNDEIDYYISTFKPFDKAGAYGIQEWIGCIGIKHIEGSFYNIMGLPVQELYSEILKF